MRRKMAILIAVCAGTMAFSGCKGGSTGKADTDNTNKVKEESEMSESKKSFAFENALDFIGKSMNEAFELAGMTADDFEDCGDGAYQANDNPEVYDGVTALVQLCNNDGSDERVDDLHYEIEDMDEDKAEAVGEGLRALAELLEEQYGEGNANGDWLDNIEALPITDEEASQMMIEYEYQKDGEPRHYQISVETGSGYIIDISEGHSYNQ